MTPPDRTAEAAVPDWLGDAVARGGLAVCALDAEGLLLYTNSAAERLLGVSPGTMRGRSVLDLVHPEDVSRAAAAVASGSSGAQLWPGMLRIRRSDGTYPLVEVTPSQVSLPPPPDGPGDVTAVVIRDVGLQDAHWRFLKRISNGQAFHDCVDVFARELTVEVFGVIGITYEVEGGRRRLGGSLPPVLAGIDGSGRLDMTPGTPWFDAAHSGRPAWRRVEEISGPAGAEAAERGLESCVVVPAPDPRHGPMLFLQWPDQPNVEQVVVEMLVRRPREALMLALERRDSLARLEYIAQHDGLTGLVNRSRFFELLGDASASGAPCGLCYVDVDNLKPINDTLGHQAGDRVLEECARRLEVASRSGDIVARVGGDEFAVAAPGITEQRLVELAGTIVELLGRPVEAMGREVPVGVSVGAAMLDPGGSPEQALGAADRALYDAKRAGRGTWRRAPAGA